jgi:hypothetical protein
MRVITVVTHATGRVRSAVGCARRATVWLACLFTAVSLADAPERAVASGASGTIARFVCSGPNSSRKPCRFSTPSGNIRCLWIPAPNNIACELVASGRGYRLRPTGRAKAIRLRLAPRGQTLPGNQQIVFPQNLSCHDTRTTMTCNQDFGSGRFKLAPRAHTAPNRHPNEARTLLVADRRSTRAVA